jgi:hypothetical protein
MAEMTMKRLDAVGCKTALRLFERAIALSYRAKEDGRIGNEDANRFVIKSLSKILDDYVRDQEAAGRISCNVK